MTSTILIEPQHDWRGAGLRYYAYHFYLRQKFGMRVQKVSIDAGFAPKELPRLMDLPAKRWQIEEHSTWRGAVRVLGWRD